MLQNLQNFGKFQKFQLDNLVDFEKCYKMRIYLQRSAQIQPKTTKSLPKICQKDPSGSGGGGARRRLPRAADLRGALREDAPGPRPPKTSKVFHTFCNSLAGSFSAVSKRNFATKYAFDSIFQALQDLHTFAPLQSQKFSKKSV